VQSGLSGGRVVLNFKRTGAGSVLGGFAHIQTFPEKFA
jgi:hypothetical protein